jgi:hypothetical protein
MTSNTNSTFVHRSRVTVLCLFVGGASALLAACGNPPSPGIAKLGTTSTTIAKSGSGGSTFSSGGGAGGLGQGSTMQVMGGATVAYSECMRQHGVPSFPDPNSQGSVSITNNAGVSSTVFQSATGKCSKYMKQGRKPTAAQNAQAQAQALAFSRCMRAHGLPTFPDPTFHADGSMSMGMQAGGSLDPNSPNFKRAQEACAKLSPGGFGAPPIKSAGGNG